MDATEAAALAALSEKETWHANALPVGVDTDMLACLDSEGLIEAKLRSDGGLRSLMHFAVHWFSPTDKTATPYWSGGWKTLLADPGNVLVKLSDRGKVALVRSRRATPTSGMRDPPARVNGDDDEDRHPSLLLFDALNFLHSTCSSADSFQELAERRKKSREFQASLARMVGEAAAERANKRIRDGEHPFSVVGEFAEADRIAERPPPCENPQSLEVLGDVLSQGRALCLRARDALLAGGADGLDAHVAPTRSIDIRKKVMEADAVFLKLGLGLTSPSILIEEDAAAMAALADYFEQQRIELSAVLEMRGLPQDTGGPAPAPSQDRPAVPTTENAPPLEFTDPEHNALQALLELKAFDRASRVRIDDVSARAGYGAIAGGSFKQAISGLVRRKLLGSKGGRNGGVWLEPAGRAEAENGTGNGTD